MNSYSNRATLNCEELDRRDNPSGNVSASITSGGMIVITGDSANNRVQLQQTSTGDLYVWGFDNTTVNGKSSVYLGRGVPSCVRINLGAGNDRAEMVGVVTYGDVRFDMGTGNDQVVILGCTAGQSMEIYGQDGDDDIYLSRVRAARVVLDGGNGFDVVHADNTFTTGGVWVMNCERAW